MKNAWIASVAVALFCAASDGIAESSDCASALTLAAKKSPAQNYDHFDQTPGEGWRALAEQKSCFVEAGRLIDTYLVQKTDLRRSQRSNLSFHAGQVYAMAGRDEDAVKRFRAAADTLHSLKILFL